MNFWSLIAPAKEQLYSLRNKRILSHLQSYQLSLSLGSQKDPWSHFISPCFKICAFLKLASQAAGVILGSKLHSHLCGIAFQCVVSAPSSTAGNKSGLIRSHCLLPATLFLSLTLNAKCILIKTIISGDTWMGGFHFTPLPSALSVSLNLTYSCLHQSCSSLCVLLKKNAYFKIGKASERMSDIPLYRAIELISFL